MLAPFPRPVAQSREFKRLLRQQVDLGYTLEVKQTTSHRRDNEVSRPGRQELRSDRPAVTGTAVMDDPTSRTARTSPTRPRRRRGYETDSEAEEEIQMSIRRDEERRHRRPNRSQIPDRDWEIISIVDRDESSDLLLYRVRWAYTKHPTALLHEQGNEQVVLVDGEVCKVMRRSTAMPDEDTGEATSIVEWSETWLSLWELCDAFDLVVEYEQRHARTSSIAARRKQPLFASLLARAPWILEAEAEEDPDRRGIIDSSLIEPEERTDYTMSFLEWQRQQLEGSDGLQIPTTLKMLNMPIRQRLVFSDWFCARDGEEPKTYDTTRDTLLRALFVYIVGDAWVPSCSSCDILHKELPFPKCVVFGKQFGGACTNCAFLGRGTSCELHHEASRETHISRCFHDMSSSASSASTSPASSPGDSSPTVGAGGAESDTTPPSSPPSRRWVPRSTTPPESPELGTDDVGGGVAGAAGSGGDDGMRSADRKRKKRKEQMESSQSGAAQPGKRRRRRMKMRIVKQEQPSASSIALADSHADCPGPLFPCTHPSVGCEPPEITDDSEHPPCVVFNDRVFGSGHASDEEVRYILSRCSCANTQFVHNVWENEKADAAREGDELEFHSKEEFLSLACYEYLTELARMACPVASCPKREEIDLTGD